MCAKSSEFSYLQASQHSAEAPAALSPDPGPLEDEKSGFNGGCKVYNCGSQDAKQGHSG